MEPEKDAIWKSLEDTQPIPITTEVFRDDSGWWERFGQAESANSSERLPAGEEYQRP